MNLKPIINKLYTPEKSDVQDAQSIKGLSVYYSDSKRVMTRLKPAILQDVNEEHEYPYKVAGEIGRWKYVASILTVVRRPAIPAYIRMRKARLKAKESGANFRTFRVNKETLEKANEFCKTRNIALQNILIELFEN